MAYTPELSDQDSSTLRRVAWALDLPMTKTLERVFETVVGAIDASRVCAKCKDRACEDVQRLPCVFFEVAAVKGAGENMKTCLVEDEDEKI